MPRESRESMRPEARSPKNHKPQDEPQKDRQIDINTTDTNGRDRPDRLETRNEKRYVAKILERKF